MLSVSLPTLYYCAYYLPGTWYYKVRQGSIYCCCKFHGKPAFPCTRIAAGWSQSSCTRKGCREPIRAPVHSCTPLQTQYVKLSKSACTRSKLLNVRNGTRRGPHSQVKQPMTLQPKLELQTTLFARQGDCYIIPGILHGVHDNRVG